MKIAIIGSRNLTVDLSEYIPEGTTSIISGGAKGIDTCAANYAKENRLELIEFLPDYKKYGKGAPLKRNDLIIDAADIVLAFWDGKSKGTKYGIDRCKKSGKEVRIFISRN